ncbi:MAG: hypothetical protein WBW04_19250 [Nitrolancea sp.]
MAVISMSVVGMLFTGCSSFRKSTATTSPHQTFSYGKFSTVDPGKDLHPRDELTLKWEPVPERTAESNAPAQITLLAGLYGPFDTVDALKNEMSSSHTPGHTPKDDLSDAAVGVDPIETDSWSSATYTSTLALPSNLRPGYYSLVRASVTNTTQGTTRSSSQTVLHVSLR